MSNRHDPKEVPEEGRADISEIADAPYSVVCHPDDLDMARRIIEDLEEHDVPANAIELVGARTKASPDPQTGNAVAESGALWSLSRSTIAGASVGIVVGALLGLLMASLITELPVAWGLVIGALFGGGVGIAAGGMSVAKYSSPAWDETYEVEETPNLLVGVHHADVGVIETAETVMKKHTGGDVTRLGRRDTP